MLLNVEDLTEDQLKKIGLPPNPGGWNCFDTERMEYGDAIWCFPIDDKRIPDLTMRDIAEIDDIVSNVDWKAMICDSSRMKKN